MVVQGNKKDKVKVNDTLPRSMKMKNIAGLSNNTTFGTLTIPFSIPYRVPDFPIVTFLPQYIDGAEWHVRSVVDENGNGGDPVGQTFTCTQFGFLSSIRLLVTPFCYNQLCRTSIQLLEYNGDELATAFNGKILSTSLQLPDEPNINARTRIHTFEFPQTRLLLEKDKKYTFRIFRTDLTRVSSLYTYSGGRALPSLPFKDVADRKVSIKEGFSSMIFEVRAYLDFSAGFD